jgi:DMSO/TMAO reductase YedYZ molybdopterin-dependent catalytic subunit
MWHDCGIAHPMMQRLADGRRSRTTMAPSVALPPGQQLAAAGKWPVVGERLPAPPTGPWLVSVSGLVASSPSFSLDELKTLPQVTRSIDIHCVTRWSKLAVEFTGVPLVELLELCQPTDDAAFLSFVAHSQRRHSTSLPLEEAVRLGTLIAFAADGQPLSEEHGGPVRTIVPGKYFYKSLKWLVEIRVLAQDQLGFWEGKAGYHNEADPWKEQRYVAANLNRVQVAKALKERRFAGLELLGLDAAGIELEGLDATEAILRNADFRNARLSRANFDQANLSNAHFAGADLRGASFRGTDVEGADFTSADLRGCDFHRASLLGVSLVSDKTGDGATIDSTTQFSHDQLDQLAPRQAAYVLEKIGQTSS